MSNEAFTSEEGKVSKKLSVYILLALSILLLGAAGYFFYQYQKLSKNPIAAQIKAQEESQKLVAEIGKIMLLPKDETPTVATVSDIDKLKDQPFFENAANGNKVLIYPDSKLAIIYDPENSLIVNVGPINFSGQQIPQAQNIRVALRNGTDVAGLTYEIETTIKDLFPEGEVTLKDQGGFTNYEKTIIVVFNDASKDAADKLAKILNSQVDRLPEGETKPADIDILIIVGKDKI